MFLCNALISLVSFGKYSDYFIYYLNFVDNFHLFSLWWLIVMADVLPFYGLRRSGLKKASIVRACSRAAAAGLSGSSSAAAA